MAPNIGNIYIISNPSERLVDAYQFQVRAMTEEREMVIWSHSPYLRHVPSISSPGSCSSSTGQSNHASYAPRKAWMVAGQPRKVAWPHRATPGLARRHYCPAASQLGSRHFGTLWVPSSRVCHQRCSRRCSLLGRTWKRGKEREKSCMREITEEMKLGWWSSCNLLAR